MGNRYADHVTPLYPQKLALTSPTGGGRSIGIVRSRTKATEFSFSLGKLTYYLKRRNEKKIKQKTQEAKEGRREEVEIQ